MNHRQNARRRSDPTWPTWRTVIVTTAVIVTTDVAWLVFSTPLVIAVACGVLTWAGWLTLELVRDHLKPRSHRSDDIVIGRR